jgi:UDP-GlcNAc:undecaprenyl-phosphate GlcNAc-1-phosphate transferase
MVAIMTLRLLHFDPAQKDMMELAAIVAGASLGLLPYSWYPSKIMWGFGAITAGVVLAAISVISQAKIATSIIVLTVPFLDGVITVTRRLLLKKSPFKGDRGHLHHLLLERGWDVRKVALFYWVSTFIFGLVGVYAADKDPILTALTGMGFVAFAIISLNLQQKTGLPR